MKRYFIQWFFLAILSINICTANQSKINFFFNPEVLTSNDVLEQLDSKSLDMCWQFGQKDFFHFVTKKNGVYFEVLFDKIPSSYDKWIRDLFTLETEILEGKEKKHYIFSYESKIDGQYTINQPHKGEKILDPNQPIYLVDERRIFEKSSPQLILADDIASIICNNNVIFYTGAGLSVASGVPSMSQLQDLLGLKEGEEFIDSLKYILKQPARFVEKVHQFHHACFFSPPTQAHKALKDLAIFKNTKIVTENLDCLHEYSGILPYRINAEELRKEVGAHQLSQIAYILCVGLSYDDRGFLGWYKRNNPKGKIIAIDLRNPSYLGDEDFIIKEDLQRLIPQLANKILKDDNSP